VRYADFLQVIARRLQTKETVDQLLVCIIPEIFPELSIVHAGDDIHHNLTNKKHSLIMKCRKHSRHSTKRIEVLGKALKHRLAQSSAEYFVAGTIAPEELRHILSTFGEVMDQAEIEEFLAEADVKCPDFRANGEKTGLINYFAFVGLILDIPELETLQTVRKPSCTIRTR
jgi:hypothetical protein